MEIPRQLDWREGREGRRAKPCHTYGKVWLRRGGQGRRGRSARAVEERGEKRRWLRPRAVSCQCRSESLILATIFKPLTSHVNFGSAQPSNAKRKADPFGSVRGECLN